MMKNVMLLGDAGSGKTTLLNIMINKQFLYDHNETKNLQVAPTTLINQNKTSFVNIQIWDTPSLKEYQSVNRQIYKKAQIFIIILDKTNPQALNSCEKWINKINNQNGKIIILANKIDLDKHTFEKKDFLNKFSKYEENYDEISLKQTSNQANKKIQDFIMKNLDCQKNQNQIQNQQQQKRVKSVNNCSTQCNLI